MTSLRYWIAQESDVIRFNPLDLIRSDIFTGISSRRLSFLSVYLRVLLVDFPVIDLASFCNVDSVGGYNPIGDESLLHFDRLR